MIVREIVENPELLDKFDFFNDYKDTLRYLESLDSNEGLDGLIRDLQERNLIYWEVRDAGLFGKRIDYSIQHEILDGLWDRLSFGYKPENIFSELKKLREKYPNTNYRVVKTVTEILGR